MVGNDCSPSTARTSEGSTSRTRIFYKLLCLGTFSDAKNHKISRPSAPRRSAEPISRSKRYNGRGKLWSVVSMLKEISATLLDSRQSAGHDGTGCVLRSKMTSLCYHSHDVSPSGATAHSASTESHQREHRGRRRRRGLETVRIQRSPPAAD